MMHHRNIIENALKNATASSLVATFQDTPGVKNQTFFGEKCIIYYETLQHQKGKTPTPANVVLWRFDDGMVMGSIIINSQLLHLAAFNEKERDGRVVTWTDYSLFKNYPYDVVDFDENADDIVGMFVGTFGYKRVLQD